VAPLTNLDSNGETTLAFDSQGDIFMATTNDNIVPNDLSNSIYECTASCLENTADSPAPVLLFREPTSASPTITGQLSVGGMAVDPSGNLFFTDSNLITQSLDAPNTNPPSSYSDLNELFYTGSGATGYAATPTVLYTETIAAPTYYDDELDAVAISSNGTVYVAQQNEGIFAFPNQGADLTEASVASSKYTVSTQGFGLLTVDAQGNLYGAAVPWADHVGANALAKIAVNNLTAPATPVGVAATNSATLNPITTILNDNYSSCASPETVGIVSSTTEFSAMAATGCVATVTGGSAFPTAITFTPAALGIRTATLTATDSEGNTGTATVSGVGLLEPQTIAFTVPPPLVTYGVSPIALVASGGASGNPVIFSVLSGPGSISATMLTITGAGTVVVAANQAGNSNYAAATEVTQSITVSRAILTVTANSVSIPYGTTPVLTASITGLVNGNTSSVVSGTPVLATTATSASLPGSYPITIGQGTLSATNYTFALIGGTVTVTFTASVPAKGTLCDGAYYGTFSGNLTVSAGQTCIFVDGGVTGNIQQSGGVLDVIQSTVGGNLQVTGGGMFTVTSGSVIKGNLQIQNIPAGSVTNQVCGDTIDGNLQFQGNGTAVLIGAAAPASCPGNVIGGNLTVQSNTAPVTAVDNTVKGNLTVQSNTAPASVVGNTVTGNLTVQSNTAATTVDDNKVSGNLQDQSNTAATQVFTNIVGGNLQCQGNAAISGGGNTSKSKQGQCSAY
jgi:hypothetical protein